LIQVMEKAHEEVIVVLEGQGADELLGYQQTLFIASVLEHLKSFEFKEAWSTIQRTLQTYSLSYAVMMYFRQLSNEYPWIAKLYQKFTGIDAVFTPKLAVRKKLKDYPSTNKNPKFDSYINKELYKQHSGGLVNLLHYGDAISMAHSLESRLPFMDFRLVEFAFKLPWQFKLHIEFAKYIHRQAMKGIVPDSILDTPLKFGFNTPISQFFKTSTTLSVKPVDILLSDRCLARNLFNKSGLIKLMEEHNNNIKNHSTLLYRLLSVELWFREFIDGEQFK
jgi:asparagine synthase (glutamine-hydrolysing)